MYFTESTNGDISDLVFKREEAIRNANTNYGTGFFISKDGKLVTNRHVVYPVIDNASILATLKIRFDNAKFMIEEIQNDLTAKISNIENYVNANYSQLDYSSIQALNEKKAQLYNDRSQYSLSFTTFDFDPSKSVIKTQSSFLGIAYENTFVNRESDFKECVILKKSEDNKIDLAEIQLKDKTTPQNIKTIFDFEEHNPNIKNGTAIKDEEFDINKPLKIDTKLYMIGFNSGFEVANTTDGLKAQLTQGSVSQESDNNKVLYSIPSLPGSSGSPIIDKWGNLVAINFAKVHNSQNFNYGIPVKHIKKIIDGRE